MNASVNLANTWPRSGVLLQAAAGVALTVTGGISILWPIIQGRHGMRRTRHVIAVMVVATALCADRAVAAAPASSSHARTATPKSLAARITTSFRQTLPSVRLQPSRTMESVAKHPLSIREEESGIRSDFSPFQFRLPPPVR